MQISLIMGIIIICLSPLIIGMLFAGSNMLHMMLYKEKAESIFAKREFYLYALFLLPFFLTILVISLQTGIIKDIGLKLPCSFMEALIGLTAILAGISLYYFELLNGIIFTKIYQIFHLSAKSKILIGNVDSIKKKGKYYKFYTLILLSIIINFFEEFMWRGFLITVFKDHLLFGVFKSIFITSLLFGINHYYFGLQTIIVKSLSGIILGIVYVLTSNVLFPFICHTTFNIWLWWRLRCLNI